MTTRTHRLTGALATGALLASGLLALAPAGAQAQTTASTQDRARFSDDAEGFAASSSSSGLCAPPLLCPSVTATYAETGGTEGDGDGYLDTKFSSLLTTVAGTTTAGWLSPAFTYTGVGGAEPTSLTLDLAQRVSLDGLLGLDVGNDSSYRVDLVDVATGKAVSVIPSTQLTEDTGWTAVPAAAIDPSRLTLGDSYQLRVLTTYHSLAGVVASGEMGVDDVRLSAARTTNTDTNTTTETVTILPADAPKGTTTPAAGGITSTRMLRQLVRTQGLTGPVKLVGNHVKFTVACFSVATHPCKYAVQGLAKGKGSATTTSRKVLTVQPGARRSVRLAVNRKYLATYRKATKIVVRAKVRVGVYKVTVVKRLDLRR